MRRWRGGSDRGRRRAAIARRRRRFGATLVQRASAHPGAGSRRLLVGNSAGAWGALALASRSEGLVAAVINFSGGLGGRSFGIANRNCARDRLARAAAQYGRTTRVPTLWLYAENGSYFGPALSRRMADVFRAAGGLVDYQLLPAAGQDGHALIDSRDAARIWGPIVDHFVAALH